jgi:hypothetical protein
VGAAWQATLAFDLLCQASLVCTSRSPASYVDADRVAAAQSEIRCAAYLISARLAPAGRKRAESSAWERLFESSTPPSGSLDEIEALLEHAQDTIDHLLQSRDASEDEHLASLHVGFALHELECAQPTPGRWCGGQ